MKTRIAFFLVLLIALLLWRMALPVDETEYVIVTSFGEVIGHPLHEAGLYLKKPWHSVIRLDKRLQTFDPRPSEFLLISKKTTEEKEGIGQNVVVDYFVNWRILGIRSPETLKGLDEETRQELLNGPLKFLNSVMNISKAQEKLLDIIHSELSAALGHYDMSALVSVEPKDIKISDIEKSVSDACREIARRNYGIEIEDVRIKRVGLPEQNKQSVFERMRAERQRKATQFRAEGQRDALTIRAAADKEASRLLSESYRDAELVRGKGDAEATAIYAKAHSKDPEFYRLVRTLTAYTKFLNENTTVVLSSNSELLRLLMEGKPATGKPAQTAPKPQPEAVNP